jgi:Ser-tRNA(Ala) deacylase AlaX
MADFTTTSSSSSSKDDGNDVSVVRVVTVAGWNCPCGGTHVRSTGELKERGWCVKGLKCKKGVVRVRYGPKED